MKLRNFIFHPFTVLCVSLLATLFFASVIVFLSHGKATFYSLYYVAPIGVPFIAFLFERAERLQEYTLKKVFIDVVIVGLALARAKTPIPFLSGHSLFLTYALLTSKTFVVRLTAMIVMIQVLYLKLFIWHDLEVFGGIALGLMGSIFFKYVKRS